VPTRDDNNGDEEEDTEQQLRSQGKGKQADEEAEPDSVPQSTSRRIPSAHSSSPHVQHRGGYASGQVSGASSPMPTLHFPLATPPIRQGEAFSFGDSLDRIKREDKKALLAQLEQTTHFSRDELEKLYANWLKQARNGYVGREEFEAGLNAIGISDPLIIEQNFSAFDHNKDGKINFREFVTGLSVVQKGTMEERLKFLFDAYDVDGSGTLTPDEVYNIFKASLASKGEPVGTKEIRDMVDECFRQIDVNGDGEINYEEFKTAVTNQQLMISCFVHYPTEKEPQQ
jgi:Ca2+-binding EF-hand superfamily protein